MKSIAIISSQAFSLVNFRGPLIRDLVGEGVTVHALAPDLDDDLRRQLTALGAHPVDFRLTRTGIDPLRDLVDMIRLARLLRRLNPDVTLAYFVKPVIFGTLAARLAGVSRRVVMIEGLGYVYSDEGMHRRLARRMLRLLVSGLYRVALFQAHRVIFLNQDDLEECVRFRLVLPHKTCCLGGIGVDLQEWSPAPPVIRPVTFLLAARLLRQKGIVEFIEAARLIKASHPHARFILLGGLDPNPGSLRHEDVQGWVQEGLIDWPGHVDVKPWLRKSSVFVLPSYYREGVPRSTQEAMALGRPVITTDMPGCRVTVKHGDNGFLVPVRDPEALAGAMRRFIDDPGLIPRMGARSRSIAETSFDVVRANRRVRVWLQD